MTVKIFPIFHRALTISERLKDILNDEKKIRRDEKFYPTFIAKSFGPQRGKDIFYLDVSSLIYLLYKKLKLGSKFNLRPIKKILEKETQLREDIIDNEWKE
jgi:hypothetical protein